jgi:hypothetical protein
MAQLARTGPPGQLNPDHDRRRDIIDGLARERIRPLPLWVTTPLDRALAFGVVRDDEVPTKLKDLQLYVLRHEPIWAALQLVVALEILPLRDVRGLSPGVRLMIAYAVAEAGPDLARRVVELHKELKHAAA